MPVHTLIKDRAAPAARAVIRGTREEHPVRGEVLFYEGGERGCVLSVSVSGLPAGEDAQQFLGFHIHEDGSCADEGAAAGGHFDPQNRLHGFHAGDLPVLLNAGGRAECVVYTNRFTPGQVAGRAVVIHDMPNDYRTEPSGDSGGRLACGVIERILRTG